MNLAAIAACPDQKEKSERYKDALESLLRAPTDSGIEAFTDHLMHSDVPLTVSRPLIQHLVTALPSLPSDLQQPVVTSLLQKVGAREVSYDEALNEARAFLARVLEEQEDWSGAAKVLSSIDVERTGECAADARRRLEHFIKITMLFLEDDDAVSAEASFIKASSYVGEVGDAALQMRYKACYARISDAKRRFLEAATRYYELSQLTAQQSPESVNLLLQAAVTCAILHPASSHRSRMLAMLYQDERIADVEAVPQYPILEKMLMERLISGEEVAAFAGMLKEHQRATLPDGSTVLESAVVQHNLRAAGNLYRSISLEQLGELLALPPARAEELACGMIAEGRLLGHVDQVDGMLYFDDEANALVRWDAAITAACEAANRLVDLVGRDPAAKHHAGEGSMGAVLDSMA